MERRLDRLRALRGVVSSFEELALPLSAPRYAWDADIFGEEEALEREAATIDERHTTLALRHRIDFAGRGIALCVSGGGIRSAAVACGLLWRLSAAGALKFVDHISCVSGGGFVGAAYVSDLVEMAATAPPERHDALDAFYRAALTKTILRMQRNANWLVGGRTCADRLLSLAVLPAMLLFTPLVWMMALLMPLAMWIDLESGHSLRAVACEPDPDAAWRTARDLTLRSWHVHTCAACVALLLAVGLCELGGVTRVLLRRAAAPHCTLWRAWKAGHQLVSRTLLITLLLLAIHILALALQQREFGLMAFPSAADADADGGGGGGGGGAGEGAEGGGAGESASHHALACACARFGAAAAGMGARACVDAPVPAELAWPVSSSAAAALLPGCAAADLPELHAHSTGVFVAYGLAGAASTALVLALALGGASMSSYVCSALGPAALVYVVARIAQWRCFGPLTGQGLRGLGWEGTPAWSLGTWQALHCAATGVSLALLPFLWRCGSIGRLYFTRRLVRAFFCGGRDMAFSRAHSHYCPLLTFGCTISDFQTPRDRHHFAPFAINSHHAGSPRSGYAQTPPWLTLGRALGISSAAIDPTGDMLLAARADRVSTRFWLTVLGLTLGDWLRFEPHRCCHPSCYPETNQLPEVSLLSAILLALLGLNFWDATGGGGGGGGGGGVGGGQHAPAALGLGGAGGTGELGAPSCALVPPTRVLLALCVSAYWALSFFGSFAPLRWVQAGYIMRQLRSLLLVVHKSTTPPPYLRLSDGGLCENTGLLQMLIRRQRWILAVDASHDPHLSLATFRNAMRIAVARRLCSFFDRACPERDIEVALESLCLGERTHVHLGIRYGWAEEAAGAARGELFLIKVRAPLVDTAPVPPPIAAWEIEHGASAGRRHERLPLARAELRGCCCDGCHACCSRAGCGERFPYMSSASQFFTPTLFSAFCRLGHELSDEAVEHLLERQEHVLGAGDADRDAACQPGSGNGGYANGEAPPPPTTIAGAAAASSASSSAY